MFNLEEQGGEGKAIGWISMADMFMLCSILMLAVAVGYAMSLKKTDQILNSVQGEYASYKNVSTATIDELTGKSALLGTQAAGLDQQVTQVKGQLAEAEKQRASFKTEGEKLSRDLAAHIAKLTALQSEYDTYRTTNTKTTGDLNVALLRSAKALDDSKANVAGLQLQLSTLEGKLSASEKLAAGLTLEGAKSKSTGEELARQKLKLEGELATLTAELAKTRGDLTQASGELGKVSGELAKAGEMAGRMKTEQENLLASLNSWKSTSGVLQKENSDIKLKLSILEGDKKRAEAKLTDLESTIIGLNSEVGELKPQLTKLKVDLSGANLRIVDLEKAVFEKINRAKMIVTVTADDVPKDFTLELIVTDPLSNECGPFSSVIFNEGDEIGFLQQSVDFKTGKEGSQKAIFYSMRPVYSRMDSGLYTVKAMIRHNGNDPQARLENPVTVNCSIEIPNASGPDARKVAQLKITSAGYIKKTKRNTALTSSTPYKHMWPWEPVSHFERFVCDFRVSGDRIADFRTFEQLPVAPASSFSSPTRSGDEQKIDSIRNRGGN